MRDSQFQRRARELLLARPESEGRQAGHPSGGPDSFGVVLHELGVVLATLLAIAVMTNILVALPGG